MYLLLTVTLIDVCKIPKPLLATMLIILEHIIKEVWVKLRRKKSFLTLKKNIVLIMAIINARETFEQTEFFSLMFLTPKFVLFIFFFPFAF